jgi:hypothetical protein
VWARRRRLLGRRRLGWAGGDRSHTLEAAAGWRSPGPRRRQRRPCQRARGLSWSCRRQRVCAVCGGWPAGRGRRRRLLRRRLPPPLSVTWKAASVAVGPVPDGRCVAALERLLQGTDGTRLVRRLATPRAMSTVPPAGICVVIFASRLQPLEQPIVDGVTAAWLCNSSSPAGIAVVLSPEPGATFPWERNKVLTGTTGEWRVWVAGGPEQRHPT